MKTRALLLLAASLAACQPNGKTVMALLYNGSGALEPTQTELKTVESTANLKGSVAQFIGGGRIVLDPNMPATGSDAQIETTLLRDPGGDVRANFIDRGGVLWPADFHSWNMVTAYWNFERSFEYYQALYQGEPTDQLERAKVYYWGNYEDLSVPSDSVQLKDNAIYFSPVKAFVLTPFYSCPGGKPEDTCGCPSGQTCLQKVPLALNLGVIGHEMAHRVWSQKVYDNAALPPYLASWQGSGFNILKSIDEGLADFHGLGVVCKTAEGGPGCDTNYLEASLPAALAATRNFSVPSRCMTVELRTAVANLMPGQFLGGSKQYELGTLFATALYQASLDGDKKEVMQNALLRSYNDNTSSTPGFKQVLSSSLNNSATFTLERAANVIISHVPDMDLRRRVCNELWQRLDLYCDDDGAVPCANFPACPNTSVRGTDCEILPPP